MRTTAAAIGVTMLVGCGGSAATAGGPWVLTWSDEFDGPAAQPPSAANWLHDVGTGFGNQQLEYDTDSASNAALDGQGNLAIVARREPYLGQQYTSARLLTRGRFQQAYGKFEARIKLPAGQGLWPAFWLLGANVDSVSWPACGEIDIMEAKGQEPLVAHGSLHGPGYSGGAAITRSTPLPDTGFHVYAIEWDKEQIAFLLDGVAYEIVPAANIPNGLRWVFDHEFYLILDLAVGGTYAGNPTAATPFPQTMLVDYVRVYQRGG